MVNSIYEYNKRKENIERIDKYISIISMFILCIVPLLIYRHEIASYTPILEGSNGYATGGKVDVFNYYKTSSFYILTTILMGLFLYKLVVLKVELKKTKLNIIMLVFGAILIISPLLSKYTDIALYGNNERYEGAVAWFYYLCVFFVLYNTKINDKHFKMFYWALIPFIIVNLTYSVLNIYGYNVIENEFFNNLLGGNLEGYIATTLYHPNFGSAISAVVFSVSFMYLLLEENTKLKLILLATTVGSFTMLLAMISSGGFVTSLIILPIIIVVSLRFTNIKNTAIWGGLVFALNGISYMILSKQDERVYSESFAIIEKINTISPIIIPAAIIGFIIVVCIMKFINRKKAFDIVISIAIIATLGAGVVISNKIEEEKQILEENPNANIVRIKDNPTYQKINEISTDRINIWMKTIDLINDKPLLGHGFDTYPFVIIESDEDRGISTYGEFIDKPHNWYLSTAYGIGVIGLLALISIIVYIMRGLFNYCSDKINDKFIYIYGIGFMAYIVQGMSNDSWVGTSVFFWIFAGLCANRLICKKN